MRSNCRHFIASTIRVDRKFRMLGRNTSPFADIQNIYNHQSVIEYSGDQKARALFAENQLGIHPGGRINIEF